MADKTKPAIKTFTYNHPAAPLDASPGVKVAWAQMGREINKLVDRMNQVATPGYVATPKG